MTKTALITGITGQDGSYLAEFLLQKGYCVCGMVRRSGLPHYDNIEAIRDGLLLYQGDMCDPASIRRVIERAAPDEIYNLAAQSHVGLSFTHPNVTELVNRHAVHAILETIKNSSAKFYQASTSEMYGNAISPLQNEDTPLVPISPYGIAKTQAHQAVKQYRNSTYGLFACCGILFNHESERRGSDFVTRKITSTLAKIKYGRASTLHLGNLDARRDWGYAPDYVQAMWKMLQQATPQEYVIATGEMHTVREFLTSALAYAGMDCSPLIIDPELQRPREVHALCGDASRAKKELDWNPSIGFEEMVARMMEYDLRRNGACH